MLKKRPIYFVHIPKTAGTSLRKGLEQKIGVDHIAYDYGVHSNETSAIVKEYMHGSNDLLAFWEEISRRDIRLIAGHMSAGKYAAVSGLRNIISFVRRPEDQVISHYLHFKRHNKFEDSFEEFLARPAIKDSQSRLLNSVPIEAVGFIGLVEQYEQSINIIIDRLGFQIPVLELNRKHQSKELEFELTEAQTIALRKITANDEILYRRIKKLFDARVRAKEAHLPYIHGGISTLRETTINGFAYIEGCKEAILVDVLVNDEVVVREETANALNPILRAYGVEREGFVQFTARLPDRLREGDIVEIRAGKQGQQLDKGVWLGGKQLLHTVERDAL